MLDEEALNEIIETNPEKIRFDDDGNAQIRTTRKQEITNSDTTLQRAEGYFANTIRPIACAFNRLGSSG